MTLLLAHLTDAHIGPLPRVLRRELMSKRITGYINFKVGRDRVHDMDVLARLVSDMLAHRPDHVAMTGDILNIGLQAEFPLARAWLETLGHPEQVSFAPGNHDAYIRSTLAHLMQTFAPYCRDDGAAENVRSHFPYVRVRQGVALIGLSTGVPTAPFIASGRLGKEQIAALAGALARAKEQGLARVIMMHHPPVKAAARGLTDVRAFEAVLRQHGADLVLHGHNHSASVHYLEGPKGQAIPFIGAPSASLVRGRFRAAYHLYRIAAKSDGSVEIHGHSRGLQAGTLEIGDLGAISIRK